MKYQMKVTFTEPLLGTTPLNHDTYLEHGPGANDEAQSDEVDSVPEADDKGVTGFSRFDDGAPFVLDYVLKGVFKGACGAMRRVPESKSAKLKAYKKVIDELVFVYPRRIKLIVPDGEQELKILSRPLRAQTAQGERVALAHSEMCPVWTTFECTIEVLGVVDEGLLTEWLTYGQRLGMGQWRNGGYGRYTYELEKLS